MPLNMLKTLLRISLKPSLKALLERGQSMCEGGMVLWEQLGLNLILKSADMKESESGDWTHKM